MSSQETQTLGFEALGEAPASVLRSLEGASIEKLVASFKRAKVAGTRAWMLQSIVIGLGLARGRYGDRAGQTLARQFGCSKSTTFDLGQLYREIIRPRIDRMGDRARFELAERHFYTIAVRAARDTRRPALELLELAEEQRRRDPKYTAGRFKRELLGNCGPRDRAKAIAKLLRQLAQVPQGDLDGFVTSSVDASELLDAAGAAIDGARSRLAGRSRQRAA
jgi:hypothetical protein